MEHENVSKFGIFDLWRSWIHKLSTWQVIATQWARFWEPTEKTQNNTNGDASVAFGGLPKSLYNQ